jgi:hypothetical protein
MKIICSANADTMETILYDVNIKWDLVSLSINVIAVVFNEWIEDQKKKNEWIYVKMIGIT